MASLQKYPTKDLEATQEQLNILPTETQPTQMADNNLFTSTLKSLTAQNTIVSLAPSSIAPLLIGPAMPQALARSLPSPVSPVNSPSPSTISPVEKAKASPSQPKATPSIENAKAKASPTPVAIVSALNPTPTAARSLISTQVPVIPNSGSTQSGPYDPSSNPASALNSSSPPSFMKSPITIGCIVGVSLLVVLLAIRKMFKKSKFKEIPRRSSQYVPEASFYNAPLTNGKLNMILQQPRYSLASTEYTEFTEGKNDTSSGIAETQAFTNSNATIQTAMYDTNDPRSMFAGVDKSGTVIANEYFSTFPHPTSELAPTETYYTENDATVSSNSEEYSEYTDLSNSQFDSFYTNSPLVQNPLTIVTISSQRTSKVSYSGSMTDNEEAV